MELDRTPNQDVSWQNASEQTVVCYCQQVDKGVAISAIRRGAWDIEAIQEVATAGMGGHCKELNPRGRCCHADIAALLRLYGTSRD
ncbi:MAG: (2Fe-2S)-binding protein [Phycisphaeraceae bacterium]|nr:(2Fe-2S)-binding protein [Phycisphaeraceae bacterium]